MLGLFSRRPRPNAEAAARLKGWVTDLMLLTDRDHIAIAEIACHEPGCPDLETVVTVTLADRRRFVLRFPSAVAAVTEADVAQLGPQVPGAVRTYVHLVEGNSAAGRTARIAQLVRASRRPVTIFAETADPPTSPLDWLMGPGCTCCLPTTRPRLRLIEAVARAGQARIMIDAGPAALADRIAAILGTLPVRIDLNIIAA